MLTTIDNPFDPFTQWNDWFAFDVFKGYNTCGLIDRLSFSSEELSDIDQDLSVQAAFDAIIELHGEGLYKIVTKD